MNSMVSSEDKPIRVHTDSGNSRRASTGSQHHRCWGVDRSIGPSERVVARVVVSDVVGDGIAAAADVLGYGVSGRKVLTDLFRLRAAGCASNYEGLL